MKRIWNINVIIAGALLVAGCTPRQVMKVQPLEKPRPEITTFQGDTLSYAIEFADNKGRDLFLTSFRNFLNNYPFAKLYSDSVHRVVLIKIFPESQIWQPDPFALIDKSHFIEQIIEGTIDSTQQDTAYQPIDTILPPRGGSVRLYLQRSAIDPAFSALVGADPLINDTTQGFLSVIDSSRQKITLQLKGRILNGKNKVLSALDFIELWTRFIKSQPAEGMALFRYVDGVRDFIDGKEAIVRGFGALNESTIYFRLSKPDPYVLRRLRTHRLFGSLFRLGSYYLEKEENESLVLAPDSLSGRHKPFLDKIILRRGGDSNPILSFSLNKYDAIVLTSSGDIRYARENLSSNASLIKIPGDRYFLACATEDQYLRQYFSNHVDPSDLLHNFVKVEGRPLSAIESDSAFTTEINESPDTKPVSLQPQRILYRKDDPVSKAIAEKLIADLSHYGIPSTLIAADPRVYQQTLLHGGYDCAVGWVPETIEQDMSEKLRLAAMWFGDQTDENVRLTEKSEIPLFTVDNYLLAKNGIKLYRGVLEGIFREAMKNE